MFFFSPAFRLSDRASLAPIFTSTPLVLGKRIARPSEYFSKLNNLKNLKYYYLRGFSGANTDFDHLMYVIEQRSVCLWQEFLTSEYSLI